MVSSQDSRESNFKKHIKNEVIYNIANIQRVDCFILKVCRNYYAKLPQINNAEISRVQNSPDETILIQNNNSGCLPPQAFIYFDKIGVLQDLNNVPIIYHKGRHHAKKK